MHARPTFFLMKIFILLKNFETSHARTTLGAFRLWYQLWQNRQIKTLIKRNGRHLNTSGSLA